MLKYKREIFIILILLLATIVAFAWLYSLKIKQAGLLAPVERTKTLEERAAEMIKRLEEVNRQIAASSTLKAELQKKGAAMVNDLEKTNKEINASSTLKADLNERGADMIKRLEEVNAQIKK